MLVKSHFEDCPYNCNVNGMILDVGAGKLIPCPHCSKRKRELLKQGYVETEEETQVPQKVFDICSYHFSRAT